MENKIEEFVKGLNLPFEGELHGNDYIITLYNDEDFSKLYNFISTNSYFSLDDGSISTSDNAVFIFYTDDYELRFTADFIQDVYRLTISRR